MFLRSVSLAAALAVAPLAVAAQDWAIDPSHTIVGFSINHFGYSDVQGVFRSIKADVTFNPDDIAATKVSVAIDAASIDTFWAARDEHIRSADFLDVANHPEITFVSTSVALDGDTGAKITGDLTIKGVTQEVTLDATMNQVGPSPINPDVKVAGFTITGEIDRTAFGIDTYAPAIGAVMPLSINVELNQGA